MRFRPSRHVALFAAAASISAALTACSAATPGGPASAPPTVPSTSSLPSGTGTPSAPTAPGDPVLNTLAQALPENTEAGLLVRNPGSTAAERPTPWATGWTVYDVRGGLGHPQRMFIARSASGTVLRLSNVPQNVNEMSATAPVSDEKAAIQRAGDFFELARSMDEWGYPVSSVKDIQWLPQPDADQTARREQLLSRYDALVKPPVATAAADGWTVSLWRVEGRSLVRHETAVARSGQVTDSPAVVEKDIPVPYSM